MRVSYCPICGFRHVKRIDSFDDRFECRGCFRVFTAFGEENFDAEAFEQHLASMGDLFAELHDAAPAYDTLSSNAATRFVKGGAA